MSNASLIVLFLGLLVLLAAPLESRPLFIKNENNRQAIDQLYVQAEAIVETLDEEAAKHGLAALPSRNYDKESAAVREAIRGYMEEALSPTEISDTDAEAGQYFNSLPPSATWSVEDSKVFALSPSSEVSSEYFLTSLPPSAGSAAVGIETEKVVEAEGAEGEGLKTVKKFGIDEVAENFHRFSLNNAADRLEDKNVADVGAEGQSLY